MLYNIIIHISENICTTIEIEKSASAEARCYKKVMKDSL